MICDDCGLPPGCRCVDEHTPLTTRETAFFDAYVALPEAQERFRRAESRIAAKDRKIHELESVVRDLTRQCESAQRLYMSTGAALDRTDDQRLRLRQALVDLLLFGERLMHSPSMEERAIGVAICEGARIVAPASDETRTPESGC